MSKVSNNNKNELGKFLSWILRHGAVKEGIPIAADGFVSVENLLNHRFIKGLQKGRKFTKILVKMADKSSEESFNCEPCGMKLNSKHLLTQHLETRKHRKLAETYNDTKCGVFIAGFPYNKSKEEILQYFSKFGGIRKSIVGPTMSYMIVVFEKEEEATAVLSTEHFIGGRKLRVQKRISQPVQNNEDEDNEIHQRLVQWLDPIEDFDKQLQQFVKFMTPDPRQIWSTYNLVNTDIQRALYGSVPPFNLYNFGSSTTATQFNSSDLDVYLHFGEELQDVKKSLKMIRSALSRSRLFQNIIDIPSAKVPIVRFVHKQTGMKGDINFVNKLGVENSKLISYFLSLDYRLRYAILLIKYWSKIREISGRNHLFTSYSMAMMFIFYLQQRHNFPSVLQLQISTEATDPDVIWNMNIVPVRNRKKINQIHSVSMLDILKGFFEYYSNFDFNSQIICPYLGKMVEKQSFDDIDTVPNEFELYKENLNITEPLDNKKPVCLQDPFELNINTCKIIFGNILDRFVAACFSASKALSGDQKNMLVNLLSPQVSVPSPKKNKKDSEDPDSYNICLNKQTVLNYLKSESVEELAELWFKHTLDYCQKLFEEVLRLELKPMENNKCARVGDQQDVHDCDDIRKFHASAYLNVWDARNINSEKSKEITKDFKTSLEKEIVVSASIWEENKAVRPSVPIFECKIVLTCLKEPNRVNIEFTKISSYKKIFKSFGKYINGKIPQWYSLHTKELNQQEIS